MAKTTKAIARQALSNPTKITRAQLHAAIAAAAKKLRA